VNGPGPNAGVIFQEYGVFPWLTVKQNIAFGCSSRLITSRFRSGPDLRPSAMGRFP